MSTYSKTYPGTLSLEELETQIAGDEAGGILVKLDHDDTLNMAEFKYRLPSSIRLELREEDDVPEDYESVCSGELLVEGEPTKVMAIRKEA